MLSLLLASSLWVAASEAGAREQVQPVVPVERVADKFASDLTWLVASHAADLGSTAWALRRCNVCAEGNPLGPDAESRLALKLAGVSATGLAIWKLRRAGHNRGATVLRWSAVAVNAALAVHNSRIAIRKHP